MDARTRSTALTLVRTTALIALTGAATTALRRRLLRAGATDEEVAAAMAGDDLIPDPYLASTRGITIPAAPADVWPWLVQIGQDRGGFYSYDFLENLMGLDIHSAGAINPAWQQLSIGDDVHLAADVALSVVSLEPQRSLVLQGGVGNGQMTTPLLCTWAFVLRAAPEGGTRLLMRERYGCPRPWAALVVEATALISSLMSPRMLRGIRQRAGAGAV